MRIIGGTHKRKTLIAPADDSVTRPYTDRVKETLFNKLMARGVTGEGCVLDVFAGIGSMGLEALSRGAEHCTFIERHRQIARILQQNIDAINATECATILQIDCLAADLRAVVLHQPIELAFVDPPYAMSGDKKMQPRLVVLLEAMATVMEPEGIIVFRSESPHQFGEIEGFLPPEIEHYGHMIVHLYEREAE